MYVLYRLLFNSLLPMYGNNNFLNVFCMLILIFDFSTFGSLSVNSEELLIIFWLLSKSATSRSIIIFRISTKLRDIENISHPKGMLEG